MGKILVIGSAVADVIIKLEDHLPVKGEDVHVLSQEMRLGGCAYNVFDVVRHFCAQAIPFFPIGSGPYADFVAAAFKERGIVSAAPRPAAPNGCCYCFIEADGERTFIVYHGAEYRFEKAWFDNLDTADIDMCYICGLEIEESTGSVIVDFLENNPHMQIFFAPGPRILKIDRALMQRLFLLHPILHLNEEEAFSLAASASSFGGRYSADPTDIEQAMQSIFDLTEAIVIVTLGEKGSASYDGTRFTRKEAVPTRQLDTIGAGDSHAGACLALLHRNLPIHQVLETANRIAAQVVATPGALLPDEVYNNF